MKEVPTPIVMIVEDNVHVNAYLTAMLDLMDIEAISTSSTKERMFELARFRNSHKHIDALIFEGREPIEKAGLLITEVKQFDEGIEILALVRNSGARHKLVAAGADVAVTKPVSGQTVVENVLMLLRDQQGCTSNK